MKKHIKKLLIGLLLIFSLLATSSCSNTPQETTYDILPNTSEEQITNTDKKEENLTITEDYKTFQDTEPKGTSAADDVQPDSADILLEENNSVSQDTDVISAETKKLCTLSVRCDTILNNIESLKKEKRELIPKGGIIFAEKEVEFFDNESVFDVLLREMRNSGIHLEFENTPAYNSIYIEGIANLYEFDCGDMSGWKYKVNGVSPSRGCSQYTVAEGDKIEFYYALSLTE